MRLLPAPVGDVNTLGDHELENRVAEQLAGGRHRDRAEAGEIADLVTLDPPTAQGFDVGAEDRLEPRRRPLGGVRAR